MHTGIIFRFGEGRVAFRRSQPAKAIEAYKHAMVVQEQFKSLRFISYWEITVRILLVSSVLVALFASFACGLLNRLLLFHIYTYIDGGVCEQHKRLHASHR
jgi:hypothetical protein